MCGNRFGQLDHPGLVRVVGGRRNEHAPRHIMRLLGERIAWCATLLKCAWTYWRVTSSKQIRQWTVRSIDWSEYELDLRHENLVTVTGTLLQQAEGTR